LLAAPGRVHRKFAASNGKLVTLRATKWDDLDAMTRFAKGLVEEECMTAVFGTLIDGRLTREESSWLADKQVAMENGRELSLVVEVDGRLAANSKVVRERLAST